MASENENMANLTNAEASGQANKKGIKFLKLEDINKVQGARVILAEPYTDKNFIEDLRTNNKTAGKKKVYWVFGDNTLDKGKAQSEKDKFELRDGVGNQAGALEGLTHHQYGKAAVGIVTTKKGSRGKEEDNAALSEAFKKSLEELYDKAAKDKDAVFVVPAYRDKDGKLQINIGTGIAAKHLEPESVKAMTEAIEKVITNIANGTREPVPAVELKHKPTLGQKIESFFTDIASKIKEKFSPSVPAPKPEQVPPSRPTQPLPEKPVKKAVVISPPSPGISAAAAQKQKQGIERK